MRQYKILLKKIYNDNYSKENIMKRLNIFEKEGYSYILEEDYIIICFKIDMVLIPLTDFGKKIAVWTIDFVYNLKHYQRTIEDFLKKENVPELTIEYLSDIINSYLDLRLDYLDSEKKILIFSSIKNYKFETELSIYNFAKIEVLLKILDYKINIEEVKQLYSEDIDITPIVFPIRREIIIHRFLCNPESLNTNINLLEIIEK
ncbi:hypothetical protein [Fusobacterium ulcerans]